MFHETYELLLRHDVPVESHTEVLGGCFYRRDRTAIDSQRFGALPIGTLALCI